MTSVRIDLNSAGIEALLNSGEVQADITARAERVAAAARGRGVMVDGEPGDVAVPIEVSSGGGSRARATVAINHPSGLSVESKHRLLGGSLDAAG